MFWSDQAFYCEHTRWHAHQIQTFNIQWIDHQSGQVDSQAVSHYNDQMGGRGGGLPWNVCGQLIC